MTQKTKHILAVFSIFIIIGFLTYPNITAIKSKLEDNNIKTLEHIQRATNQYYQKYGVLPAMEQPEIGKPSPLSITKLGEKNLSYRYSLWVDVYGQVYDLPDHFLGPKEVDIVFNQKNQPFLRWSSVEEAEQYKLIQVSKKQVLKMKEALGKTTIPLLNLTKGEVIVQLNKDNFMKEGDYYLYPLPNHDNNTTYLVSAYSHKYGYTPARGINSQ